MATVLSGSDTDTPVGVKPWHATDETRRLSALAYIPRSDYGDTDDEEEGQAGNGGSGGKTSAGGVEEDGKGSDGDVEKENGGGGKEGDEDEDVESEDEKTKSEAEEDAACATGKRFLLNNAERNRLIDWMSSQDMAPISQKAPVYEKKCRLVARKARAFVPTSKENATDQALYGVVWRAKRAKFASAKTIVNVRRTLPGMKNKIIYDLADGKARKVARRTGVAEGTDVAYATDCAVDNFFASKRKAMSSSASCAKDTMKKAKNARMTSKQAHAEKNKTFADARRKQKEEKEAKAAKRNARADKVAESVAMLAAGQAEVARNSARMADNAVSCGDIQKEIMLAQLAKLKKSSM